MTDAPDPVGTDAGSGRGAGRRSGPSRRTTPAALAAGVREYARTPVLVALFVFLPAYFVLTFAYLVPETTTPLSVPGGETQVVALTDAFVVFVAPLVGALVGGIAGLFAMDAAREADARLVVAGASPGQVVAARVGLLALVAALVATVTTGVVALVFVPERPLVLWGAVVLAALVYGLLGVLVGVVLNRLAGVYLVLFGSMLDAFVLQNPFADAGEFAAFLPAHAPVELAVAAGFGGDPSLATAGAGLAYVAVAAVVATLLLYRTMRAV